MSILIKTVRIASFRGLENIEVPLGQTTVLTGMNNTGKTSFLKALQLALGNRQFVSQDDFFIHKNTVSEKIIIDLLIVPMDDNGKQCEDFSEDWEILFTTDRIRTNETGHAFLPLRTTIVFDFIKNTYTTQQFILPEWPEFQHEELDWFNAKNGNKTNFHFDELPFFYMDAQRDILEDTKSRSSYLGKMLSKIKYTPEDIKDIEDQIKVLNKKAVTSSDILTTIKTTLKELDTAMDTGSEGIELTPFTKKIRDLNKGLTIYYNDSHDSFAMEYHDMGTRSWSSLLTLKSFISLLAQNVKKEKSILFPVLAIEEPEAHLHPNAQKKLFGQIDAISGQKIISTHSPYIAATASLNQILSFYKNERVVCGRIDTNQLKKEEIRQINRQVIHTRGEIFFSSLIIFCEGETEEQALPVYAEKYFDKTAMEMGLNFVGVGGFGYLPFLYFAEAFNIPWLIFSDAEAMTKQKVQNQFSKCGSWRNETDCIIFLNEGNDFEKQLINDGFGDEIKTAIAHFYEYHNEQHRAAKEPELLRKIQSHDDNELYKIITESKTQYAPVIAEQIILSGKALPPKIIKLFKKTTAILKMEGQRHDS